MASGSGIEARYAEITGNHIDGAEISRRAAEGEPAAHKVIMTAGIALGEAIAGITNLLDPDMVVIGGSVPKAGTKWRAAVQEGFERQIPLAQRGLPILAAELGGHARLSARPRIFWITWRMSRSGRNWTSWTTPRVLKLSASPHDSQEQQNGEEPQE